MDKASVCKAPSLPLLLLLIPVAHCVRAASYLGDARVVEGDSFFVACVTEPHAQPAWHKDGLPLPSWGHFLFHEDLTDSGAKMNTLYVAHALPGHSGDYSCGISLRDAHRLRVEPASDARSGVLHRDSQRACLHLCHPTVSLRSKCVFSGGRQVPNKSLEIPCELSSSGRSVTWYKDDDVLSQGDGGRIRIHPGGLEIRDSKSSDAGTYTCLGSGGMGVSVSVAAPIAIEPMPAYQNAKVNGTVTISCNIDTRPLPRVSWFLGDTPLTPTERITLTSGKNGVENAKLTIHRVNLQDRNRYTCRAAHMHCADQFASQVSTNLLASIMAITTNEDPPGGGKAIDPSEPFVLACTAGSPNDPIQWSKDGKDITEHIDKLANGTSTLTIEKGTPEDVGDYTCKTAPAAGTPEEATITVGFKLSAEAPPIPVAHGVRVASYLSCARGRGGQLLRCLRDRAPRSARLAQGRPAAAHLGTLPLPREHHRHPPKDEHPVRGARSARPLRRLLLRDQPP
ncbi:protein sax-3-like [Haemaphysalis longicornis]